MKRMNFKQLNTFFNSFNIHLDRVYKASINKFEVKGISQIQFEINGEMYYFIKNSNSPNKMILVNDHLYRHGCVNNNPPRTQEICNVTFIDQDVLDNKSQLSELVQIQQEDIPFRYLNVSAVLPITVLKDDLKNYHNDVDNGYLFKMNFDDIYFIRNRTAIDQKTNHFTVEYDNYSYAFEGIVKDGHIFTNQSPTCIDSQLRRLIDLLHKGDKTYMRNSDDLKLIETLCNLETMEDQDQVKHVIHSIKVLLLNRI